MKGFYAGLIWCAAAALFAQWNSGFSWNVAGESRDGELRTSSSWGGRLSRPKGEEGEAGLFLQTGPGGYDRKDTLDNLSLYLSLPFLHGGALKLSGLYDLAESEGIPPCGALLERGRLALDKDAPLAGTRGMALHRTDRNLIFHILDRKDYSQAGLLGQTDSENTLSFRSALLYTWDGSPRRRDEDPWYAPADSRTGQPLAHGLFQMEYCPPSERIEWTAAAAMQGQCSPVLLPGYAGYLYLGCGAPAWKLGLSWQENGGALRSCRGGGADWSRGMGWSGEGRLGTLTLKGRGLLYQPGYFNAGPGAAPRSLSPNGEGKLILEHPRFSVFHEWKDIPLDGLSRTKDGISLIYERERLASRVSWEIGTEGKSRSRRAGGKIRFRTPALTLEGKAGLIWPEERGGALEGEFALKGEWRSLSPGTIILSLKGTGEDFTRGAGKLEGEICFESPGF